MTYLIMSLCAISVHVNDAVFVFRYYAIGVIFLIVE